MVPRAKVSLVFPPSVLRASITGRALVALMLGVGAPPAAGAQSTAESARAHYQRGVELERQKNLDGAAAEYRMAIDLGPSLAAAHDRLGFVLGLPGHTEEAVAEFRSSMLRNRLSNGSERPAPWTRAASAVARTFGSLL